MVAWTKREWSKPVHSRRERPRKLLESLIEIVFAVLCGEKSEEENSVKSSGVEDGR